MSPPVFTLIAGANGAGKSTLTAGNPETFSSLPLLDPDAFTLVLSATSTASPLTAGREVLHLARKYLKQRQSFTVETTLAGKIYLEMLSYAKDLGYERVLVYIGTNNVEINLFRIQQRVLNGGHDVPEADVRRRYVRSLMNLPVAIARSDHALLFDNSTEQGYQLVSVISPASAQWFRPVPPWARAIEADTSASGSGL